MSGDELRDVYERRAAQQYAQPWELDPNDRKFACVWRLVERELPCDAFLDAGCGDGRHLAALARTPHRPRRVVGVDLSERILETARAAAAPLEPELVLVQATVEALPLEDAAFDVVLCTQVIEHLRDVDAGLRELARVLRSGGTLVLTTDNARNVLTRVLYLGRLRRHAAFDFPHRDFHPRELHERVDAAGLDVVHVETFRFTAPRGIGQRALNRLDALLPSHGFGDIVAVVARKPSR